jgi:ABC-type glycerol-3-phosphate transport system substrate-binding protein
MTVLALLALLTLLLAGPAAAQGTLTLYTSESLDKVNEMKADFEKRRPGTTLNIYRSGTQVVIGKLQAEIQAGRKRCTRPRPTVSSPSSWATWASSRRTGLAPHGSA